MMMVVESSNGETQRMDGTAITKSAFFESRLMVRSTKVAAKYN